MIHVFGHINPDSDAICTAVVTAHWLTGRGMDARAWRLGEANRETRFIFDTAGLTLPPLLAIPLQDERVWLVDFTEPAQGPDDLLRSNVVGITDHHRLGGLITQLPPEVHIRPVGSSATLLWLLMDAEARRTLPPTLAVLLLGALLSDTVNLRSPTTTEDDMWHALPGRWKRLSWLKLRRVKMPCRRSWRPCLRHSPPG
ncbi:inorganic pyrophosphatase/exopolyphosphatase [Pantoea ananatis]